MEGRGIEWWVEGRGGHTDTELQPADINSLYIKQSQLRLTATFLRPKVIKGKLLSGLVWLVGINLLAPELFFFNFSTSCI